MHCYALHLKGCKIFKNLFKIIFKLSRNYEFYCIQFLCLCCVGLSLVLCVVFRWTVLKIGMIEGLKWYVYIIWKLLCINNVRSKNNKILMLRGAGKLSWCDAKIKGMEQAWHWEPNKGMREWKHIINLFMAYLNLVNPHREKWNSTNL
jgi:hypothetical protein